MKMVVTFSESPVRSEGGPLRKKFRKGRGEMTSGKAAAGPPFSLREPSPFSPTLEPELKASGSRVYSNRPCVLT